MIAVLPISSRWHCLIRKLFIYRKSHSQCTLNHIAYLIGSDLIQATFVISACSRRMCVCTNGAIQIAAGEEGPLLRHGSPSRLFRDASQTLPSSFSTQHAKLNDLEGSKGTGCQVTRVVCQVLNMPPSQQCLADGWQHLALTNAHTHSGSHYLNLNQTVGCVMVSTPYKKAN